MAFNLRFMWKKNREKKEFLTEVKRQFALQVFLSFVCPVTLLSSFYFVFSQNQRFIEERIAKLEKKTSVLAKIHRNREEYLQKYAGADPDFLSKYVEPVSFLSSDVKMLSEIQNSASTSQYKPLQDRLLFLQGDKNRLRFKEIAKRENGSFYEKQLAIIHPVEVDALDIGKLLSLIEGVEIGEFPRAYQRPDLQIQKIHLIKKENCEERELYTLDLELTQRGSL